MKLYRKVVYILTKGKGERSYSGYWNIKKTIYDENEILQYREKTNDSKSRYSLGAYVPYENDPPFVFDYEFYKEEGD